ncbi:hypothetical protein [Streptomyces sp. NPDC012510]|uniref:hypothetical protein n=1 Tax=Streptomyces sp. NPDC012510 TaxID=3364838 RepID=UPI0036E9D6BC
MPISAWIVVVTIPEALIACVLLRWLPAQHERWICAVPVPVVATLAVTLRFASDMPWQAALAAGAGFLWGIVLALLPFRGWVSSWTLPVHGEARLRWREVVLIAPAALTPLSTKRTDAAMEKAFAVRQVVRARGPFPPLLGMALLVLPVMGTAAARWAFDTL